jgi:hypothetical protein
MAAKSNTSDVEFDYVSPNQLRFDLKRTGNVEDRIR